LIYVLECTPQHVRGRAFGNDARLQACDSDEGQHFDHVVQSITVVNWRIYKSIS